MTSGRAPRDGVFSPRREDGRFRASIALLAVLAVAALTAVPAPAAEAPDRSVRPPLGPPPSLSLPPLERLRLDNGLEVVVLEKHQVPIVQIALLVRAGSVDDASGKTGLAEMAAAMLDEGAGGRSALDLADAIDGLGATLETFSDYHVMGVRLFTPLAWLNDALPLMADVVLRPDFPAEELERQRADRLTELLQARDEPRSIAAVEFDRVLYGRDHPYGRAVDAASLRAIGVDDLERFHDAYFRPDNATLVVVGDVTVDGLRPLLDAALGGWRAPERPLSQAEVAQPRQVEGRTVYLVDKPGAAQSVIRIGSIGAPRNAPDYFALQVMNTVLGGSFTSRLNANLREDKGYTYGAASRFSFRPVAGPFLAAAAVQTDVTDKALVEFMKELTAIRSISDDDAKRARNYVALRYPQRFQTVSQTTEELEEVVEYGLPDDYFNRFVPAVLAVSRQDAEAAAATYVRPDHLAIVVVGDREKIDAGVRALGLGEVVELTVEDVLGPAP